MVGYPTAGSARQLASREPPADARLFGSQAHPHSVHVRTPSPSNLELPRQTQGTAHCTPNSPKCYAQGTPPKCLHDRRLSLMVSHVRAQRREAVPRAVVHPVEPAPSILLQQGVHDMAGLRVQLGGDGLVQLLPGGVDRLRSFLWNRNEIAYKVQSLIPINSL